MSKRMDLYIPVIMVCGFRAFAKTGCPILYFTGIPCLGCGMTRACLCLLRLDFTDAFYYHPLSYFMPAVMICYLYRGKIGKNVLKRMQWIMASLFVLVYAIRLLNPDNILIKIDISSGLLYKIAYALQGGIWGEL